MELFDPPQIAIKEKPTSYILRHLFSLSLELNFFMFYLRNFVELGMVKCWSDVSKVQLDFCVFFTLWSVTMENLSLISVSMATRTSHSISNKLEHFCLACCIML